MAVLSNSEWGQGFGCGPGKVSACVLRQTSSTRTLISSAQADRRSGKIAYRVS